MIRGIRGATTVAGNEASLIYAAAEELMREIAEKNMVEPSDISQVLITVTADITAAFPAGALRNLEGYQFVPVMCAQEIPVPGSIDHCIRFMVSAETELAQDQIQHIYLNKAEKLRPDLSLTKKK